MFYKLKRTIGSTARLVENYGGFEITVIDTEKFPWVDVFTMLLDSGFQVWINKTDPYLQIISKQEVD